ncbi:membrane-bound lytic murein transglycosylase D [Natronospira proteinivora]|uniref:Membrane-bound lytic murein transglycosylase D n=1 Tax=Natronospira proteinivora TaxID=1807133 RepID=A0ABT1G706_9GAMM|nr:LysM peptidoglycan-binding domain-containing protein [Natronospira proteinivora]MCP1727076.1 membrane-bound lytic murein transglycosylase D [Natronospira proteinivora]
MTSQVTMDCARPLHSLLRAGLMALIPVALLGCAALPWQQEGDESEHGDPDVGLGEYAGVELDTSSPVLDTTAHLNWQDHADHLLDEDGELREPADVWERIRRGWGMEGVVNSRVEPQLRWHERNPAYMDRVATRAEPFLAYILDEIEERGLPTELALLPIVESAYDPFAYSHGRAAGMWQFIPSTGRHFGLKQNWWYDGRRDFIASTDAALTYMENLAERFDGDWELALAAYNAGGGNVSRAIRRNRQQSRDLDYWSLRLPRETMHYVPKMMALREVIENPEKYGVSLRPIDNEPRIAVVELDGQLDLALAAELAEMDIDEVYRLNAGFNRWATDPDGPHRLVVPIDRKKALKSGLADLDPEERISWHRHEIQPGESLNVIARRYNITVEMLQDVNELRDNVIRTGDHLLVPQAMASADAYSGSVSQRLERIQNTQRGNRERVNYQVQPGDSFWSIAQQYNVNVRQLAQWNGMAPGDTLRVGQSLTVWVDDPALAQAGNRLRSGPADRERQVNYQVRSGDSLARIASRFGVSVNDLLRWNSLSADDYLQPGQKLTIIVDVTNTSGS